MKLRSRASLVTHTREGNAPASTGARLTRWLYVAVVFAAVAYLVWYVAMRSLHVLADGEVVVRTVNLAAVGGGRITALPATENQRFRRGDLLATVDRQEDCTPPPPDNNSRLDRELAVVMARYRALQQRTAHDRSRLGALDLRRALELDPEAQRQRKSLREDVRDAEDRLLVLQAELVARQAELAAGTQTPAPQADTCGPEHLLAPFDGRVRTQLKQPFEVVTRSEPMLVLVADAAPVRLRLYLQPDEYPDLVVGEAMEVRLPDGRWTPGVVDEVVSAARELAATERENYRALKPDLLVWVRPADEATADAWRQLDRLVLEVRGQR